MAGERVTTAAGGIVWRRTQAGPALSQAVRSRSDGQPRSASGIELALVHRPSYDDWTFPKGKSDPGESLQQTAVREILEETGLRVRLGHPLSRVDYRVSSGQKQVSYWMARLVGSDPGSFTPNREVDELRWVRPREAARLLSYAHDRDLLEEFRDLRDRDAHRSRTLVVLRHAKAQSRASFDGDDLERPLAAEGVARTTVLARLLEAYGVSRVVTSPALRCAQTVEPYAHTISTFLEIDDRLSEETKPRQVERSVRAVTERKKPVVLCSHRPTLPWVFDALGLDPVDLKPGEAVVVHHRKGKVLATERL